MFKNGVISSDALLWQWYSPTSRHLNGLILFNQKKQRQQNHLGSHYSARGSDAHSPAQAIEGYSNAFPKQFIAGCGSPRGLDGYSKLVLCDVRLAPGVTNTSFTALDVDDSMALNFFRNVLCKLDCDWPSAQTIRAFPFFQIKPPGAIVRRFSCLVISNYSTAFHLKLGSKIIVLAADNPAVDRAAKSERIIRANSPWIISWLRLPVKMS